MLNKFTILAFATVFGLASSQNCGIQGEDGADPIYLPAVKESQLGGALLSSLPIYNVSSTGAVSSPHARYLRVLRYETRYEIQSAEPFPEFVQTERVELLRRDVIFTCSDTQRVQYAILIPVEDENTEEPSFSASDYNATVTGTVDGSLITVNADITISDADVNKSNADLVLRSSNPRIVPLRVELESDTEFLYRFDVLVPGDIGAGDYTVVLTADDGKHAAFATLKLTVLPADEGETETPLP